MKQRMLLSWLPFELVPDVHIGCVGSIVHGERELPIIDAIHTTLQVWVRLVENKQYKDIFTQVHLI